MIKKILFLLLILVCCVSVFVPIQGQDNKVQSPVVVEQTIWNFTNKTVPERFNLLSVLITNNTKQALKSATLKLSFGELASDDSGETVVQTVNIAPNSSKWVQFHLYVEYHDEYDNMNQMKYNIDFGGGLSVGVHLKNHDGKQIVFLHNSGDLFLGTVKMNHFDEKLFPVSVSATDALEAVVLDSVPHFFKPQKKAFVNWLQRGGTVHVLKGSNNQYPDFPEDLDMLNQKGDKSMLGAGHVVYHKALRRGMSYKTLASLGYPRSKLNSTDFYSNINQDFFRYLKELVKVKHNWALIFLLIFLYLILVIPVNYLYGRKSKRDYKKTIAMFLSFVVLFSILFNVVGARGYGEETKVYSLTYAQALPGGQYDVNQWSNVFVTEGDIYNISYKSRFGMYTASQPYEKVSATALSGMNHFYQADIPVYSSKSYLYRGELMAPVLTPQLRDLRFNSSNDIDKLSFQFEKDVVPQGALQAWAYHNGFYYNVNIRGNDYVLNRNRLSPDQIYREENSLRYDSDYGMGNDWDSRSVTEGDIQHHISRMSAPALLYAMGGSGQLRVHFDETRRDSELIHFFVLAKTPKEFYVNNERLTDENGYTLYHFRLPLDSNGANNE